MSEITIKTKLTWGDKHFNPILAKEYSEKPEIFKKGDTPLIASAIKIAAYISYISFVEIASLGITLAGFSFQVVKNPAIALSSLKNSFLLSILIGIPIELLLKRSKIFKDYGSPNLWTSILFTYDRLQLWNYNRGLKKLEGEAQKKNMSEDFSVRATEMRGDLMFLRTNLFERVEKQFIGNYDQEQRWKQKIEQQFQPFFERLDALDANEKGKSLPVLSVEKGKKKKKGAGLLSKLNVQCARCKTTESELADLSKKFSSSIQKEVLFKNKILHQKNQIAVAEKELKGSTLTEKAAKKRTAEIDGYKKNIDKYEKALQKHVENDHRGSLPAMSAVGIKVFGRQLFQNFLKGKGVTLSDTFADSFAEATISSHMSTCFDEEKMKKLRLKIESDPKLSDPKGSAIDPQEIYDDVMSALKPESSLFVDEEMIGFFIRRQYMDLGRKLCPIGLSFMMSQYTGEENQNLADFIDEKIALYEKKNNKPFPPAKKKLIIDHALEDLHLRQECKKNPKLSSLMSSAVSLFNVEIKIENDRLKGQRLQVEAALAKKDTSEKSREREIAAGKRIAEERKNLWEASDVALEQQRVDTLNTHTTLLKDLVKANMELREQMKKGDKGAEVEGKVQKILDIEKEIDFNRSRFASVQAFQDTRIKTKISSSGIFQRMKWKTERALAQTTFTKVCHTSWDIICLAAKVGLTVAGYFYFPFIISVMVTSYLTKPLIAIVGKAFKMYGERTYKKYTARSIDPSKGAYSPIPAY